MGRLFRIFFQSGSERSGKQCYYKHNGKGNNIVRIVKMECQSRSGKKKLKTSTLTTEVRIPHSRLVVITAATSTPNINCDNITLREPKSVKATANECSCQQYDYTLQNITQGHRICLRLTLFPDSWFLCWHPVSHEYPD